MKENNAMLANRSNKSLDLLQLAFNIDPDAIAAYSHNKPRNKINAIFALAADDVGVERVLHFCSSVKLRSGVDLKIHKLLPLCIDAQLCVSSKEELEYLAHFCDEDIFTTLAAEHKLLTFDFVSEPQLPTYIFK